MLPGGLLTPSLAEGAQLVVLSGYTANQPAGPVRVVLDQRGARVVLVLASYETVAWQLDVRPGTELVAVVVSLPRGGGHRAWRRSGLPPGPAVRTGAGQCRLPGPDASPAGKAWAQQARHFPRLCAFAGTGGDRILRFSAVGRGAARARHTAQGSRPARRPPVCIARLASARQGRARAAGNAR